MGRLVLAGLLVATSVGVAAARPTRKVQVETEPPGAAVYIDDTADGPVCDATPCTINAPIGSPTIIIRLDKYEPVIDTIDVPKGRKPLQQKWKLRSAMGTFTFDAPKGATVLIDEQDKGKIPVDVDTTAEPHHVVVKQGGKTLFDDIVDVAIGDEVPIKVTGKAVASNDDGDGDDDEDDDGDGDGDGSGSAGSDAGGGENGGGETAITEKAEPAPRSHWLTAAVAFDVGFRHVTYDMPVTSNLREESEAGQVIAGPAVEVFPMRLVGMHHLRGLSLFLRAQFGVHGQQLTGGMLTGQVTTFWGSYEASLRHRWMFGSSFGVEASGGYVRDQMQFNATNASDVDQVPDALYQSLRLGGKLVIVTGTTELYAAAENRIVLSGGNIASRFDTAKATGLRGAIGAATMFGPITARIEGALMRYSWTFQYDGMNDVAQADGATDSVRIISMLVGYVY